MEIVSKIPYEIFHSLIFKIIDLKHRKRRHIECLFPAVVIKFKPVGSKGSKLWPWLEGEEVRGPTSWAVPADGTGTVFVEAVKVPLVPGLRKPPRRVEKQFQDHRVAVSMKEKAKKPAGLKTRTAWLRQDRLGASLAVCRSNTGCQECPCKP
jgi:hypothetical protein